MVMMCDIHTYVSFYALHLYVCTYVHMYLQNLLALGSDDRTLTINNLEGDTIHQIPLRHEPSAVSFGGKEAAPDSILSAILGGKTLFFLDLDDYSPVELAFQQRYGNIVSHKWSALFHRLFAVFACRLAWLTLLCMHHHIHVFVYCCGAEYQTHSNYLNACLQCSMHSVWCIYVCTFTHW